MRLRSQPKGSAASTAAMRLWRTASGSMSSPLPSWLSWLWGPAAQLMGSMPGGMGGLPGRQVQWYMSGVMCSSTWVPARLPSAGSLITSACRRSGPGEVTRSLGKGICGAYFWMSGGQ